MMVAMLEYKKSPAAFMMCFFFFFSSFLLKMNFGSCLGDFKGMNGCPSLNVSIRICQ